MIVGSMSEPFSIVQHLYSDECPAELLLMVMDAADVPTYGRMACTNRRGRIISLRLYDRKLAAYTTVLRVSAGTITTLRSGLAHGDAVSYYNGVIVERTPYYCNIKHGLQEYWYNDGSRKMIAYYDRGKQSGLCWEWYKWHIAHPLDICIELSSNKNDLRHGLVVGWDSDGRIVQMYGIRHGQYHGMYVTYGEGKQTMHYRHGKSHGMSVAWSEGGVPYSICSYADGHLYGIVIIKIAEVTFVSEWINDVPKGYDNLSISWANMKRLGGYCKHKTEPIMLAEVRHFFDPAAEHN